uniref:Uncharacterized protein n=1 Tax=Anguilla anguilla TaxID=7936 RepID=A0A0E9TVF4_ANGAN
MCDVTAIFSVLWGISALVGDFQQAAGEECLLQR